MEARTMRMLMKVSLSVEKSNEVFKSGTFPKIMETILAEQKPEAAYFFCERRQAGRISRREHERHFGNTGIR
jgi:hypothetical protein